MPAIESPHQGRLLLCNIGRIGDTIIRNSILDSARKRFDHIDYICGKGNREIVEADSRLNHVHVYSNSLRGLMETLRTTVFNSYDCHIDLKDHASSISLMIATLARARLKIGCNGKNFGPFHRDTSSAHNPGNPRSDAIRAIAKIAGLHDGGFELRAFCTKDSESWFENLHPTDAPFYFVNISATDPARMWSTDKWVRTLTGCRFNDWPIWVSGVPKDAGNVNEIAERIEGGQPFSPRCLMDVVAAIKRSAMMFSVDTGLVQIAAAFGTPFVALYISADILSEFAPEGENCVVLLAKNDGDIDSLDPAEVTKAVKESGVLCRVAENSIA